MFDIVCNVFYGEGFLNVVGEVMVCVLLCVVMFVGVLVELVGICGLVMFLIKFDDLFVVLDVLI